jgi:hypothetical protein
MADGLTSIEPMKLRLSWQTNSYWRTEEISRIVRNAKDYYCVHKSPPLVPTLNQKNTVQGYLHDGVSDLKHGGCEELYPLGYNAVKSEESLDVSEEHIASIFSMLN